MPDRLKYCVIGSRLTHHPSTVGRGCSDRFQDGSARLPEVLQVVIVISVVDSVVALLGQLLISGGQRNFGLRGERRER